MELGSVIQDQELDPSRKAKVLAKKVKILQDQFTDIEKVTIILALYLII